jgi:hypothetical protein
VAEPWPEGPGATSLDYQDGVRPVADERSNEALRFARSFTVLTEPPLPSPLNHRVFHRGNDEADELSVRERL